MIKEFMKEIIGDNLLRKMNLIVLTLNKEELNNLGALMLYKLLLGSNKNLLYFEKFHSLPNEAKRYVVSPLKLN